MKTKTKKTLKTILKVVGIVAVVALVGSMALSLIANARERNPDNLLEVDDTYLKSTKTNYGLTVDVDDNGVIKLKGDTSANEQLIVQTLTLPAGEYTISGINHVDLSKMTLCAKWGSSEAHAGTGSDTFTLDAETEVTVYLEIEGAEDGKSNIHFSNRTIYPVLVEGDEAGSFWK